MKVIVGDELGLLKAIDANKSIMESKYGEIKKTFKIITTFYFNFIVVHPFTIEFYNIVC